VFARWLLQFLGAGTRILNIRSNGGFTAVAVVMFTGSAGSWERIFDAGNAVGNKIIFSRSTSSTLTNFEIQNVAQLCLVT